MASIRTGSTCTTQATRSPIERHEATLKYVVEKWEGSAGASAVKVGSRWVASFEHRGCRSARLKNRVRDHHHGPTEKATARSGDFRNGER